MRLEGGVDVPARASPSKARKREVFPGVPLGDVPGRIDAQHEERGNSPRPGTVQRGEPVRDLLDVGAIFAAQPVDRIAVGFGAREEAAIGHHDRAGRIVGEAHVQQLADALIRRGCVSDHPLEHRGELYQRELIGERKGPIFGSQLGRHQEDAPVGVIDLADVAKLGLGNDRCADSPRFLQSAAHRLRHRQRVAQRPAQRLAALFEVGIMVAVLLDIVPYPVLRRHQSARVDRRLFLLGPCWRPAL